LQVLTSVDWAPPMPAIASAGNGELLPGHQRVVDHTDLSSQP
jgi:hypothetical protein